MIDGEPQTEMGETEKLPIWDILLSWCPALVSSKLDKKSPSSLAIYTGPCLGHSLNPQSNFKSSLSFLSKQITSTQGRT